VLSAKQPRVSRHLTRTHCGWKITFQLCQHRAYWFICGRYQVAGSGHGTDYTDRLFRVVPKALPIGAGEFFEILGFFQR